jgi:photosystem II stability/assembly factor-like uncharacterized protein
MLCIVYLTKPPVWPIFGKLHLSPDKMKKPLVVFIKRWIFLLMLLSVALSMNAATASSYVRDSHQATNGASLRAFQLVSASRGWLLLGERLYWSDDSAAHWRDITPSLSQGETIHSIQFLNPQQGWLISSAVRGETTTFNLLNTSDGGDTWHSEPIDLSVLPAGLPPVETIYLDWIDAQTGWLTVRHMTGSNFSLGSLLSTRDGGDTWVRLSVPLGEPVSFQSARVGWQAGGPVGDSLYTTQDGGITWQSREIESGASKLNYQVPDFGDSARGMLPVLVGEAGQSRMALYTSRDGGRSWKLSNSDLGRGLSGQIAALDMADPDSGWAQVISGECAQKPSLAGGEEQGGSLSCQQTESLLSTGDGGRTWQVLNLPGGGSSITESSTDGGNAASLAAGPGGKTALLAGQGFDICEMPGINPMTTWWKKSPYYAVNLYIGGSSRACNNSLLSPDYLAQLDQLGWKFIPTWVGPQAPCTSFFSTMTNDKAKAYEEGRAEANAAVSKAQELGLTLPDKTGTVIYYDLEAYDVDNTKCRLVADKFIKGWVDRMTELGDTAGVYGATCTSGLQDIASFDNPPEAIWLANWLYPGFSYEATVWNVYCIPASYWSDHQRIRQYSEDHDESWGGVYLKSLDSDVIDGIVASLSTASTPKLVPDDSYLVLYDGWAGYQDPDSYRGGYRTADEKGQTLVCKDRLPTSEILVKLYKGPDQGKARLLVDGTYRKFVDLYRQTPGWVNVKIGNLPDGNHQVEIRVRGLKRDASSGREVQVSGCRFGSEWVDDLSYDFVKFGNWKAKRDKRMRGGWYRLAGTRGATLSFVVSGSAFSWKTAVGPSYGKAELLVDGTLNQVVDLYAADWAPHELQVSGLAVGQHLIEIRALHR